MNFRQIKMLNDLEASVAELMKAQATNKQNIYALMDLVKSLANRIEKLENPPKRRPGRPRKIVNE